MVDTDLTRNGAEKKNARSKKKEFNSTHSLGQ